MSTHCDRMPLISSWLAWRSRRSAARQYSGQITRTASACRFARKTVSHAAIALSVSQGPRGRRLRTTAAGTAAMTARPRWNGYRLCTTTWTHSTRTTPSCAKPDVSRRQQTSRNAGRQRGSLTSEERRTRPHISKPYPVHVAGRRGWTSIDVQPILYPGGEGARGTVAIFHQRYPYRRPDPANDRHRRRGVAPGLRPARLNGPDRPIAALKGAGNDWRHLQSADDIPALQYRFVLELSGGLRIDRRALSGGAAWPDYRRRPAPEILGGAARQSQYRNPDRGRPRMGRSGDDRRNAVSAA